MTPVQNGHLVVHYYERPSGAPVQTIGGTTIINVDYAISEDHFDCGRVDFIVRGDLYRCPKCGHEIITGFGKPLVDYDFPQEHLKEEAEYYKAHNRATVLKRRND